MSGRGGLNFWCHQCNRSVRPNAAEEITCPLCNGGFLEELENPNPSSNARNLLPALGVGAPFSESRYFAGNEEPAAGRDSAATDAGGRAQPQVHHFARLGGNPRNVSGGNPAIAQFVEAISELLQGIQPQHYTVDIIGGGGESEHPVAGLFNPALVMQGPLQNSVGGGGNVELAFDNGSGAGPRGLPGNIGDYFVGPGLQQLIQHLSENDPNRYGTPPASKSAIQSLPTIHISEEHMGTDYSQCAVCKDVFDLGTEVRKMPCKHMYHAECILPWLAQHNSCPVCRHELPTDDPEYNQAHLQQDSVAAASGLSTGGEVDPDGNRGTVRGFRLWGNPENNAPVGSPSMEESVEAPSTQGAGSRSYLDAARGGSRLVAGSGGISRRFSFEIPWPFGFNNSGTASRTTLPETSGERDASQVWPSTTETGGPRVLGPSSDVSSAEGGNGNDAARVSPQEHFE